MTKYGNLDGTNRDEFTLGKEGVIGIRIDEDGNVILFDLQWGSATLTEMMAGGGGGSIIETRGIITREGGLVYSRNKLVGGPIKLVVQNP